MSIFTNFAIKSEYERIVEFGDQLGEVEKLIDWKRFRPIIRDLYANKMERRSSEYR